MAFNKRILSCVRQAKPGDEYHFFNFKYTCRRGPLVRMPDEELRCRIA